MGRRPKLAGYEFYRDGLGSPKFVVAPMVDQSELAWRMLSRRYGAELVYTPMINAKMFAKPNASAFRQRMFDMIDGEEGGPEDRPLIVQFCANNPQELLTAAKFVEPFCDAVDINLGCPQDIAKKGHYGSFLQDDWELVYSLINILHANLSIPVTAKFRVFPSLEKSVEYAKMIERAGAQILTCHGRTREQRGHNTGLADWIKIAAIKAAVSVPVFANGNVLYYSDIQRCLNATKADAVMSAEGQLYNAALFSGRNPCHADLALEYLNIVKHLKTRTAPSAIKGHMFKLMRPAMDRNKDLRDQMGKITARGDYLAMIGEYEGVASEMKTRMQSDKAAARESPAFEEPEQEDGRLSLPHWVAQPYFRPVPEVPRPSGSIKDRLSQRQEKPIEETVDDVLSALDEGEVAVASEGGIQGYDNDGDAHALDLKRKMEQPGTDRETKRIREEG